jgi:predicted Ser/Thr protein kinase
VPRSDGERAVHNKVVDDFRNNVVPAALEARKQNARDVAVKWTLVLEQGRALA